ncbi:nitroreductase [Halobacillus sp. Marseille-Q1614]|uniref:nitroreductase family protein n=1 Tax=Halobacillus sp. Marseille-Q1614 TaxID=2709134 RepID=UPI001570D53E|nr:nitroreductase [Halobacillus sp. Marseille-Q1614]
MELIDAIKNRRSIHDFKREVVDPAVLQNIFNNASWAPTHRMKQPWSIVMFQEQGSVDYADLVIESYFRLGLADGYKEEKAKSMMEGIKSFLVNIPHHAVIYMEKDKEAHKYEEDYAAVCAYIQNVQLIAWDQGVGMLWTTSPYINDEEFIKGIGLDPDIHKIAAVLQIGYPRSVPKAKKRAAVPYKIHRESIK